MDSPLSPRAGQPSTEAGGAPGARRSLRRLAARLALTAALLALLAGGSAGVALLGNTQAKTLSAQASKPKLAAEQGISAWSAADAAATSAAPGQTDGPPASLGSGWKQTFNAGFSGSTLDTSVWGTCYPWEPQSGCTNFGNASTEFQWYMPSQDQVSGGALHIVPERTPTPGTGINGAPKTYDYRSGMVTTFPSYQFQYGYLQVVARIPQGPGNWSALWLAAANEQWPPEIDILEHWTNDDTYYQYWHPVAGKQQRGQQYLPDFSAGYHTFGLYWSSTKLAWFIDGRQVFQSELDVPHQAMYFIADLAMRQPNVPVNSAAETMDVKSVKVWQQG